MLSVMFPHLREGGHIDFGADPICSGICIGVTVSCVHNILWTSGWILFFFCYWVVTHLFSLLLSGNPFILPVLG